LQAARKRGRQSLVVSREHTSASQLRDLRHHAACLDMLKPANPRDRALP